MLRYIRDMSGIPGIIERLKRWLAPPEYKGEFSARRARTAHIIALATIAAAAAALLIELLAGKLEDTGLPLAAWMLLAFFVFLVNKQGKTNLASLTLTLSLIFVLTWLLFNGKGIHDIAITLYPVIMMIIAILFEARTATLGYAAVFASVALVVFGEINGWFAIQNETPWTGVDDFFLIASILGVTAVGLTLTKYYMRQDLERAQTATAALQASEARFRSLAEHAPSLIANIDRNGTMTYANAVDLDPGETLVGESIFRFLPPEEHAVARQLIEEIFATGVPAVYEGQLVSMHQQRIWYNIRVGPAWENGQVASLVLVATNIQELKEATETLQRRTNQLAAINKITGAITRIQSLSDTLEEVLTHLRATLPLDAFFVGLWDENSNEIYYPISYDGGQHFQQQPHRLGEDTNFYQVITKKQPIRLHRSPAELEGKGKRHMLGDANRVSASILIAPLMYGERVIGVVSTQSYTHNAYTLEHQEFLMAAAGQIGIAVENARLYAELQNELAERQRSETALARSEARLRALVENIPYDLWMCDVDGRTIFQSAVSRRISGDLIGKHPQELGELTPSTEHWLRLHQKVLEGETVFEESEWLVQGEMHSFVTMLAPVLDADALMGLVGINIDVTDLKRSEDSIRRYAARIEILHEIDQAILAVRSPQEIALAALSRLPRLVPCSTASLALLDVETMAAQVVATLTEGEAHPGTMEIVPFQDPERLVSLMQGDVVYITDMVTQPLEGPPSFNRVLLQGPIHAVIAVPLRHQDKLVGVLSVGAEKRGQLLPEDVQIAQEITTQLAISIYQAQLTADIQELNIALEQRVLDRTAELEAAYKELEAFSYMVSHDLRAPLRAISGYMRLLQEDFGDTFEAGAIEYLDRIEASAKRMNQLIDDLLMLSRVGRQEIRRSNILIGELVRQVLGEILTGRDLERTKVTVYPMPAVHADQSLLRQVLQNLIDNALKYSRTQPISQVEIGSFVQEKETVFYVRDNGVGFDMEYAGRLFRPFERLHAHDEFEGTGIGLAIVRRILQRHQGRIWAEAAPGQGATFYFTFGQG
jgi:PAS domain S-box-containing protein